MDDDDRRLRYPRWPRTPTVQEVADDDLPDPRDHYADLGRAHAGDEEERRVDAGICEWMDDDR